MYTISKIKKHNKNYIIELTGHSDIEVTEDTLLKYFLKKGKEIDKILLKDIIQFNEIDHFYQKAIVFIAFKRRTEKEVKEYLKGKDCKQVNIPKVIKRLKEKQFINDQEYTRLFVEYHAHIGKKGPKYVENELKIKGVKPDIISSLIHLYTDQIQLENIEKILAKELKKSKKNSIKKEINRVEKLFITRGFHNGLVQTKLGHFKEELREIYDDSESLIKHLHKAYVRLSKKTTDRHEIQKKVIASMIQKGYLYADIIKYYKIEIGE